MIEITDLNGRYRIIYSLFMTKLHPDFCEVHDVIIDIKTGRFHGVDHFGRTWSGWVELKPEMGPRDALIHLRVDPRTSKGESTVWHYDGLPKGEPVDHDVYVKIYNLGNGHMAKGSFSIGPVKAETMVYPVMGKN